MAYRAVHTRRDTRETAMDNNQGQSVAGTATADPAHTTHESGRTSIPITGGWTLTFRGHTWHSSDMNAADVVAVVDALGGGGWDAIDPAVRAETDSRLARKPVRDRRTDTARGRALNEVFKLPVDELLATII